MSSPKWGIHYVISKPSCIGRGWIPKINTSDEFYMMVNNKVDIRISDKQSSLLLEKLQAMKDKKNQNHNKVLEQI